jgi:hypothetical protein
VAEQALVDERLQYVQVGVTYLFGCVDGATACEDGDAGEQLLLSLVEQVM